MAWDQFPQNLRRKCSHDRDRHSKIGRIKKKLQTLLAEIERLRGWIKEMDQTFLSFFRIWLFLPTLRYTEAKRRKKIPPFPRLKATCHKGHTDASKAKAQRSRRKLFLSFYPRSPKRRGKVSIGSLMNWGMGMTLNSGERKWWKSLKEFPKNIVPPFFRVSSSRKKNRGKRRHLQRVRESRGIMD